jgi:HEAT repeat protein
LDIWTNAQIYGSCLVALGRTDDPEASSIIERALKNPNRSIYEGAALGLAQLSGTGNIEFRLGGRTKPGGFEGVAEKEKLFASVLELARTAFDSNLQGYFTNPAADHFEEAMRGISLLQAPSCELILRQAASLFGSNGVSRDSSTRFSQVCNLSKDAEQALQDLSRQFNLDPDRLRSKVYLHIAAHLDDFRSLAAGTV